MQNERERTLEQWLLYRQADSNNRCNPCGKHTSQTLHHCNKEFKVAAEQMGVP
jgi:hypothetical protein